jgi:hypothetical protein
MSLASETLRVVRYIDETGDCTAVALSKFRHTIHFSDSELEELAWRAFGDEVNRALVSTARREALRREVTIPQPESNAQSGAKEVSVKAVHSAPVPIPVPVSLRVLKVDPKVMSVTVRVLEETMYDIRGDERKSVADFETDDVAYLIERNLAVMRGHQQHQALFEYILTTLLTAKVKRVRELPIGEQEKIGRMLLSAKGRRSEPPEPPPDGAVGAAKLGPTKQGPAAGRRVVARAG